MKRKEFNTNQIADIVGLFRNISIGTGIGIGIGTGIGTGIGIGIGTGNSTGNNATKSLTFTSIDMLISKIDDIEINDNHFEHSQLIENYDSLLNFKTIFNGEEFKDAVVSFMDKIDSINQYYLKNVCFDYKEYTKDCVDISEYNTFDINSLQDTVKLISNCLIMSLNTNDISKKLEYVLTSYKNILMIIDDYKYSSVKRPKVIGN